jgi:hypothetical protein
LITASLFCGSHSRADNGEELAAWDRGDYKESFRLLNVERKKFPTILGRLALHYALGLGIARDEKKAEVLVLEAAKADVPWPKCPLLKLEAISLVQLANAIKGFPHDKKGQEFAKKLVLRAETDFQYKKGVCPDVDNFSFM